MKVLLICNKFPYPATDGSSIAIMQMIDTMLMAKMDVHLFSLNTQKHHKNPNEIQLKYGDSLEVTSIDVDTKITASNTLINLMGSQSFHVSRFFQAKVARALEQLLKAKDFDIIQFEGIFMAPYLGITQQFSKAKTILRPHNVEHKIWERFLKTERNFAKSMYLHIQTERLKKYELEIAPHFDAILAISEPDLSFFLNISAQPSMSMSSAINLLNYPELSSQENNFFYLGAMDWMPNVAGMNWFLKEVWPLVLETLQEAQFVLAGREMPQELLTHNQKGVRVLGEIDDAQAFYRKNGILVIPLLSGSGIRIKLIEGLSYGKAIVSTNVGAEGVATANGSNILLRDSPQQFADAMIKLYKNKEQRLDLGRAARKFALSEYNMKKLSEQLLHFYLGIN